MNLILTKNVATNYNGIVATKEGDLVSAMKKGTKLTETPKDFMLRVRLDEESLRKLDEICERESLNRSAVVRRGIDGQYEKK